MKREISSIPYMLELRQGTSGRHGIIISSTLLIMVLSQLSTDCIYIKFLARSRIPVITYQHLTASSALQQLLPSNHLQRLL
jgi:hypothetical protein